MRPVRLTICRCVRASHTHGTHRMYQSHGCRCTPCKEAWSQNQAEAYRQRRMLTGKMTTLVDAAPSRERLKFLRRSGATVEDITALTGMSSSMQTVLINGYKPSGRSQQKISSRTEAALQKVTYRDLAKVSSPPSPGDIVATDNERLQLRSLTAAGWSAPAMAGHCDVPLATLQRVLSGFTTTEEFRLGIAGLYDRLYGAVPPAVTRAERVGVTRALGRAAAAGWTIDMAEGSWAA